MQIRTRDAFLCVYCLHHDHRINFTDIEVHHITPIREDYDRRLDDDNLISLCREHHEQAEDGTIDREALMMLARAQEENPNARLPCP